MARLLQAAENQFFLADPPVHPSRHSHEGGTYQGAYRKCHQIDLIDFDP